MLWIQKHTCASRKNQIIIWSPRVPPANTAASCDLRYRCKYLGGGVDAFYITQCTILVAVRAIAWEYGAIIFSIWTACVICKGDS